MAGNLAKSGWDDLFEAADQHIRDNNAWSDLYREVTPTLTEWLISRYGFDSDEATGIINDAISDFRNARIAGKTSRLTIQLLWKFLRYRALTLLRSRKSLISLNEIEPVTGPTDPESDLLHKLIIEETLERLEPRCSYVLREKYFLGKTSAEIAATLDMQTGAIDVLLSRCRAKCREILQEIAINQPSR